MKAALQPGLPLESRHHSGADDSWNIAALVLRMASDHAGQPDAPYAVPR
jgi:hypothetical protein